MTPNIKAPLHVIYRTPEYIQAYTEGFEAGKRAAMWELSTARGRIKEMQAFSTSTGTSRITPIEPPQ